VLRLECCLCMSSPQSNIIAPPLDFCWSLRCCAPLRFRSDESGSLDITEIKEAVSTMGVCRILYLPHVTYCAMHSSPASGVEGGESKGKR